MAELYDHIVIGAGTAGCLLANRLSSDPARRILLLEAGGRDDWIWLKIPVGYLYCIGNPRADWCWATEAEPGLGGRSLLYPRGRVLGGCSAINGMIYMRGQARDYAAWADATGEAAWRWENALPDFMRHESNWRLDADADPQLGNRRASDLHGRDGELRVERQRLRWDILDAFAAAAVEAGVPARTDFNDGDNEGVGYFEVTQRRGWRWSSARAFLHPVADRANLTIRTGAQVDRLLWEDRDGRPHCVGARLIDGTELRAAREVALCAGAVASPAILLRSGVGPAAHLHETGVSPLVDAPEVGGNLQDHLQLRVIFKVSGAKTLNQMAGTLFGKAMIGLDYALRRSGPMSMAPSQLGAFTRSRPEKRHADIEFHVQPLSLDAFGGDLHDFPAMTVSVCNLNPTSRGTIRLRSPDPQDAPLIAPNYLSTKEDRRVAADSIRAARRIMAQPAMAGHAPEEVRPGAHLASDAELAEAAGQIGTTIFHPVGTTRMGKDDEAVLDPHLRLRGATGLRVADAGAMPVITSGNTNAPTLLIAEKAARWMLAQS